MNVLVLALTLASSVQTAPSAVNPSGVSKKVLTAPDFLPTAGDIAIYVATTGSDSNPGTLASPLLTLQAAVAKIPLRWTGKARIYMAAGEYIINGNYTFKFGSAMSGVPDTGMQPLVIQGAMADSGLGTRTITAVGANANGYVYQWTDSTLSMTTDQYRGYYLRVTSGPAIGNRRLIRSNTATQFETITGDVLASHPVAGNTFVIESPATVITFSGLLDFSHTIDSTSTSANFDLIWSQLKFNGITGPVINILENTKIYADTVQVFIQGGSYGSLSIYPNAILHAGMWYSGTATDLGIGANSYGAGLYLYTGTYSSYILSLYGGNFNGFIVAQNSGLKGYGSRQYAPSSMYLLGYDLYNSPVYGEFGAMLYLTNSYYGPSPKIRNSTTYGIKVTENSLVYLYGSSAVPIDISSCTGAAINIDDGSFADVTQVTGTSNASGISLTGPGNSLVEQAGVTVTGTAGDIVAGTMTATHATLSTAPLFHPTLGTAMYYGSTTLPNIPAATIQIVGSASACATCVAALRGQVCFVQGGAGVKDATTICAKDATDTYAWRTLY